MKHLIPHTLTLVLSFTMTLAHAQYEIKPTDGYSPQIGMMVDMLEEIKDRIEEDTKELSSEETDFLFDDQANSIGELIMHLIANEVYYQSETLGVISLTEKEMALIMDGANLGEKSESQLREKPATHYLALWDQVRQSTLEGLKAKDDEWFAENIEEGINNHWVWFHVMEHSVSHWGQISLIKKRLP